MIVDTSGIEIMEHDEGKYRVVFMGPLAKDFAIVDRLVSNLQKRCNLPAQTVTKMMRLAPITVKKGISLLEAQRYKAALEGMGARVMIEVMES